MKTKFFKLVLPVMALIMAITASLAFTPVDKNNSMEEDVFAVYWIQRPNQFNCMPVTQNCTRINTGVLCTVFLGGQARQLFDVPNRNFPAGLPQNPCNILLFRPIWDVGE
ncbi:DUF6520 family protein [Flavivirga aquimarina]|uniref:DUF6520 family protein n=1 Tax=Flavivirga aquimarina TaxID=2027862 RepID=A0ABT8WB68_9FLAO|nr:DUF6520 family protein [Flavivirga aquimarina]MDO5970393.1 DUF6520 family protein [Flavivirga aquimarina]